MNRNLLRCVHAVAWLSVGAIDAQAAEQLRIGVQFGVGYVPFYVAEKEGFFRKHMAAEGAGDVELSFPRFSGTPASNDALISGQIDMTAFAVTGLLVAWDRSRGTRSAIIGVGGVMIQASTMVTLKPELKTLKDLVPDDRIAVPSPVSTAAYVLRMAAERELGDAKVLDKQLVSLPNPEAVTAVLGGKVVTAMFTVRPFTDYVLKRPGAHRVMSGNDVFDGPYTNLVLGTTQRYADAHPAIVKAVIGALDEANAEIKREPRRAAEIHMGYEPSKTFDAAVVADILADDQLGYATTPYGVMAFANYCLRHGEMKTRPASWKDLFLPYIHDRPGS